MPSPQRQPHVVANWPAPSRPDFLGLYTPGTRLVAGETKELARAGPVCVAGARWKLAHCCPRNVPALFCFPPF